jgi:hypothetical protein
MPTKMLAEPGGIVKNSLAEWHGQENRATTHYLLKSLRMRGKKSAGKRMLPRACVTVRKAEFLRNSARRRFNAPRWFYWDRM